MGRVVTAACRSAHAAWLAAALWSCGLAVSGEASLGPSDDASSGGSSGSSSGIAGYGSSGASGSSSGSGFNLDTGLARYDGGSSGDGSVQGGRDAGADSHALADAGPRDAPDDGSTCARLGSCCTLLAAYGTAAMTVTSCKTAAGTNNPSTCQSWLSLLMVCP